MNLSGDLGQRFGQLLWNAVAEYLGTSDRTISDGDVAGALFYLSDSDLNLIINHYMALTEVRQGIKRAGDAIPSNHSH